ncbi:MAG: hypothetical protein KDB01_24085, partial [Planctomycetaceae bacterium]|nr:hypothetical protein [Planctomycetaceae bacterium]
MEPIHEFVPDAAEPQAPASQPTQALPYCRNGHACSPGDFFCPICNEELETSPATADGSASNPIPPAASAVEAATRLIADWVIVEEQATTYRNQQQFVVNRKGEPLRLLLTLYRSGCEPDQAIYDLLRKFSSDHVPKLYETGHWQGQAYEVCEMLSEGSVQDFQIARDDLSTIERFVDELGRVLADFSEAGLRHRDIRPDTIYIRTRTPLDLVVGGFGSARLSDLDLEIASPLETGRYTAPETVMGGISAASDWWGVGMVLLDKITNGGCFAGADDQLFMIHVIAHGVTIPDGLEPRLSNLLRGLLAVDRSERWQWKEVQKWLQGIEVPPPAATTSRAAPASGPSIRLGGKDFRNVLQFTLAAARASEWTEACDLLERGALAGWAREMELDSRV